MSEKKQSIKIEIVPIGELVPNPTNPRIASDDAIARLKKSVDGFGFVEPVIAFRGDDGRRNVIVGHQRIKGAKEAGLAEVPVIMYPFRSWAEVMAYMVFEPDGRVDELGLPEIEGRHR